MSDLRDQAACAFTVRQEGDELRGESPGWFGPRVFGGILLAQALNAAASTVDDAQMRARSLHAYFLGPADASRPLSYEVRTLRDGRSASVRAVTAMQDGTLVLSAQCGFAADREGREYDLLRADDVPGPSELEVRPSAGPLEFAFLGPTAERPDGTREQTHRAWIRIGDPLGDDVRVHEAALAFVGDLTWTAATPWRLEGPPDRTGMVSVDQAMWLHRPVRADGWLLYTVQALVHSAGRGTVRGIVYDEQRRIVASTAQELQFR